MLTALFSITLFLGAALFFCAEPMIGKLLLPYLGGSPAVWNTCMVFFQLALLGGYGLAHVLAARSRPVFQKGALALLILSGFGALPWGLSPARLEQLPAETSPLPWLLLTLVSMAGIPFLALGALAPLLQGWWARARSRSDPYFLYAASNAGSLLALAAYPSLIEPRFGLFEQGRLWTAAYGALAALIGLCLLLTRCAPAAPTDATADAGGEAGTVSWRDRFRWLLLAAAPSSLLLGVTQFLATDIASIPLLWVGPLALYLATFIVAFSPRCRALGRWAGRLLPLGAVGLGFSIIMRATDPVWLVLPAHLLVFLLAALACHDRLFTARPETKRLTEFYLCLAAGGAAGGSFNALLAPVLFDQVQEYPLVLAGACALAGSAWSQTKRAPFTPAAVVLFATLLGAATWLAPVLVRAVGEAGGSLRIGAAFAIPLGLCALFLRQPAAFALALASVLWAGSVVGSDPAQRLLLRERGFFGITQVTQDDRGRFHELVHGRTVHGRQFMDPERRCEPLAYYHRTGPFADVYETVSNQTAARLGIIGLGAGAMFAYARPVDRWTCFEIDPATVRVARDPRWFRYLSDCCAVVPEFAIGDARLRLAEFPDGEFDLIVLDAFSSDAIPVHLLTREALALYRRKLKSGGLIAMHISNRYLQLDQVVTSLAADARWCLRLASDPDAVPEEGKNASEWALLTEKESNLAHLGRPGRWVEPAPVKTPVWTDDFSSLLSVFEWR